MATSPQRDQVFISYSHKDKKYLDLLLTALKPLIRDKKFSVWDDTKLKPGDLWGEEIRQAIASAKVAILLVSPDYLASDFIAQRELPPLLEAAKKEGLTILWVAVRHSLYAETEIGRYQAVNNPSKPLASLSPVNREKELVRISIQINVTVTHSGQDTDGTGDKPEQGKSTISNNRPRLNQTIKGFHDSAPLAPSIFGGLILVFTSSLSDYFYVCVNTFKNANLAFEPVAPPTPETADAVQTFPTLGREEVANSKRINPKLFGFLMMSVFLGVAVGAVASRNFEFKALGAAAAYLTVAWFVYGVCVYVACWVLRGKGSFVRTVSVTIQLLSVIFVVSSFANLILSALVSITPVPPHWKDYLAYELATNPKVFYFLVHVTLLTIYLPIAIKKIHKFGFLRTAVIAILPIIAVIFGVVIFVVYAVFFGETPAMPS